ncbi:MAG TPA: DeoR/GlpR family DNA-binding transcription regulator [Opitutus sp.]|nr:DeoR/GlpR family DNA-binding transcription regulator [Opitutus sp.]
MRVPRHIVDQRREQLRAVVRTDGFLPIGEICRRLGVSEATARRDLAAIAANGHVTRTWGGALADYNAAFASHGERASRARSAKGRIAVAAAGRVPRSGVIFLDAGTTVQAVARQLLRRADFAGLRVVTNSLAVATMLGGAGGLELHVLGGTFLHRQAVLLGDDAVRALADWRFAAAFLGGEGFDANGVTNSHAELAAFQRAVVRRSAMTYFCLDAGKLGRTTPHRVVPWSKSVGLVTNATRAALAGTGIALPARQWVSA